MVVQICVAPQTHVVFERDVIFEDSIPFLNPDFLGSRSGLGSNELLEVANRVILIAFDPDLLSKPVVANDFNHSEPAGGGFERALRAIQML